jgi:outer membrane lipoprotein-sorting protein
MLQKIALIFFALCVGAFNVYSQTGYDIMKKNEAQITCKSTQYENTMTLINKRGQKRIRGVKRYEITDKNNNKSTLIQFIYPADVEGTSLLSIEYNDKDDDRWLYLPALKQSRRIPSADISKSFMGTDFTYEDLEKDNIEKFDYKLTGTESVGDYDCYVIEATPKTAAKKKESGYSKRTLYVTKEHNIVVHVKYYDKNNVFVKEFVGEELKQIDGSEKWRLYKKTMSNIKRASQTVIEIKSYHLNQSINSDYFTKRYIEYVGN